ncbi:hypothetical protein C0J52_23729 [Blattella germanica]|nr:hypothetical protein C0J52_23729 [Blattella germanica]
MFSNQKKCLTEDEVLDILYNDDSGDDLIPELDSNSDSESDNEAYRTDIIHTNVYANQVISAVPRPFMKNSLMQTVKVPELKIKICQLSHLPKEFVTLHLQSMSPPLRISNCVFAYPGGKGQELIKPHVKQRIQKLTGMPAHTITAMKELLGEDASLVTQHSSSMKLLKGTGSVGRCKLCPRNKDRKCKAKCGKCYLFVCSEHAVIKKDKHCYMMGFHRNKAEEQTPLVDEEKSGDYIQEINEIICYGRQVTPNELCLILSISKRLFDNWGPQICFPCTTAELVKNGWDVLPYLLYSFYLQPTDFLLLGPLKEDHNRICFEAEEAMKTSLHQNFRNGLRLCCKPKIVAAACLFIPEYPNMWFLALS